MATASSSANDLTRQQLDELDALLQRMLTLPINPADPAPPPIAPATLAAFAPPHPPVNLSPPVAYSPPVTREPVPAHVRPEPTPYPAPRLFTPQFEEPARLDLPPAPRQELAPVQVAEQRPAEPPPVLVPTHSVPVEEESAALPIAAELPFAQPEVVAPTPGSEPVPLLLLPMVLFNRLLNGVLGVFGPPGRLLRTGFVKNLFGLAGLGLIAYTAAKVAQINGWIELPVELPWPR